MNSRDRGGWHGMALALLFALVATLSIGAQALAPASAGAYQPVCDDEDPLACYAAPPGGDGNGDNGGWGDSGWGDPGGGWPGDDDGSDDDPCPTWTCWGDPEGPGDQGGIPTSDSCAALESDLNNTLVLIELAIGSASPEEIQALEQESERLSLAFAACWDAVLNNTPRIGSSDAGGRQSAPAEPGNLPGGSGAAAQIENAAASPSKSAKWAQRHRAKRRKQSHARHT